MASSKPTHGIADPVAAFEALRPLVRELRRMQRQCQPMGADYMALAISLVELENAARHFTGRRSFYGDQGDHR